jgi:F-type H+-transporting ATPase subunit delta
MAKLVSKTYGDALFAVALESNRMDEFFEAVKVVADLLRTNEEFGKLMNHPKITKEDKVKIVEETLKEMGEGTWLS